MRINAPTLYPFVAMKLPAFGNVVHGHVALRSSKKGPVA